MLTNCRNAAVKNWIEFSSCLLHGASPLFIRYCCKLPFLYGPLLTTPRISYKIGARKSSLMLTTNSSLIFRNSFVGSILKGNVPALGEHEKCGNVNGLIYNSSWKSKNLGYEDVIESPMCDLRSWQYWGNFERKLITYWWLRFSPRVMIWEVTHFLVAHVYNIDIIAMFHVILSFIILVISQIFLYKTLQRPYRLLSSIFY